jgi:ADP-ribose pyrophosphatase YjhB (NUDIX family)
MFKKIRKFLIETVLGGSADRIYPVSYQAVDVVVFDKFDLTKTPRRVLMGHKWEKFSGGLKAPKQEKRFIGGFVDPKDTSLEFAARRELSEEGGANLEVSQPKYVGSFRVEDPRYTDSPDKIMSAVFLTTYVYGYATAGDDIATVEWVDTEWLRRNYTRKDGGKYLVAKEHWPLVNLLIEKGII